MLTGGYSYNTESFFSGDLQRKVVPIRLLFCRNTDRVLNGLDMDETPTNYCSYHISLTKAFWR